MSDEIKLSQNENIKKSVIEIMLGWVEHNESIEITADKLINLFNASNRYVITYKDDQFEVELHYETIAESEEDAVDIFWKTHDVLSTIISVEQKIKRTIPYVEPKDRGQIK